MSTLRWAWHELVLRHGNTWVELTAKEHSRREGVLMMCPCGTRWLGRAPWFRYTR